MFTYILFVCTYVHLLDLFPSIGPMSPTSPLTSLSSPSRARANQSNQKHPLRLTVEPAEPRTVQTNASGGGSRHGIPAHLRAHPTHPGHSMALQTSSTPNNLQHVFEHSATVFHDSTQIGTYVFVYTYVSVQSVYIYMLYIILRYVRM